MEGWRKDGKRPATFLALFLPVCKSFPLQEQPSIVIDYTMVWVGIDLKDHLVTTLLPWAGTPSTSHASQSPVLLPYY